MHRNSRGHRRALAAQSVYSQAIRQPAELLEQRIMLAAHIVGGTTIYSTIQAAVNAASAGATITVDAGTYAETVTVNKQLTIDGFQAGVDARGRTNGNSSNSSIITGAGTGTNVGDAFNITASNVTISGFTVQNETSSNTTKGAGIVIAPNISGTHILDNILQNNVAGLFLSNNSSTNAAVIQFNVFQNNNNNGANGGRGIYSDGPISGGNLTNVTIDNNTFTNNHGGSGTTGLEAACAFEGQTPGDQSDIRITNNTFTNNGKSVLFMDTTGVLIQGNTASGAADWYSGSLRFEGNNHNVTIQYNNIINNPGPGVAVDSAGVPGDSSGFAVNNNNIYGNGTDYTSPLGVVYNNTQYDGAFDAGNNYWGSASGPSGDGPGTGNAVYGVASKGNSWTFAKGGSENFSPWATSMINITGVNLPTPPSGLIAQATSASEIDLAWSNTSTIQTGVIVQRSSDDVTFIQIASLSASATSYSDVGLSANTTYYYRVIATGSSGNSSPSGEASDQTLSGSTLITNLSSLNWVSATAGWGTVQKNLSVSGNPLTLDGVSYATGIGTHAASTIVYKLAGNYSTFISDVGVDAEEDGKGVGSVDFQVIGDGKTLFDSGLVSDLSPTVHIDISVAGVQQLTLVANNGIPDNIDYDHSDWAGAELISSTAVPPAAATGLAAGAASTSQIDLNWTNVAVNQTGTIVQRSTDGVNFSTIATLPAGVSTFVDSNLTANTAYTYQVLATNGSGNSAPSNTATATTFAGNAVVTKLSSLNWTSATTGWGTVQKDADIKGTPLSLRGTIYATGIGTHANSTITYNLAGAYTAFSTDVGIDDDSAGKGSVDFQIIGDGKILFDSGAVTGASAVQHANVSVAGVQQLSLVVTTTTPGDIDYDHSDWAGATLTAPAKVPAAPTGVSALPATPTLVNIMWTNPGGTQTGSIVQRSTSGGAYVTLANLAANMSTYADASAQAGVSYLYQVLASNSAGNSAPSAAVAVTTPATGTAVTSLSSLNWTSATVGWGTIQKNADIKGTALSIRGTTYASGIGTHADSAIVYNLAGGYATFSSDIGIDDDSAGQGSVDFQILGDNGKVLFDSGAITGASPVQHVSVNVTGVQQLSLVVTTTTPGDIDFDHADWAGAELLA